MTTGASFDSTKRPLKDLLEEIHVGKTQLPDFQRGWVWDDDRIKSLLASVGVSFPIGALMTLETGGEGIRFKPRLFSGTPGSSKHSEPQTLVLDGQQRLTSLHQALRGSQAVATKDSKGKAISRWYYIDMNSAANGDGDLEDAVISVPADRQVKKFGGGIELDLSSSEREYEEEMFPVREIFAAADWRQRFNKYWEYQAEKIQLFDSFEAGVIKRFEQYQVPVIRLTRETPKEAVCLVFEKVNTGGVSLTVFELLTATFAAEDFQLRDDWSAREKRLKARYRALQGLHSDDFLQAISLLVTQARRQAAIATGRSQKDAPGIGCKRRDILKLSVLEYQSWADKVEEGLGEAAKFLHQQKIFKARDVPYRTQLVPLSAIFTDLGNEAQSDGARRKIARWYWCGVFGELYGGAIESRFAKDLPEVASYVQGAEEPVTISDANFAATRLLTLRSRNSAAYKGLYAILMREGCTDFRTGQSIEFQEFFDEEIDIHHIFPKKWCNNSQIDRKYFDSIINKTAIAARTNRQIGGSAPSEYLIRLQKRAGIEECRMDEILASHWIPARHLKVDGFWSFYEERAEALLQLIERAMERDVPRVDGAFRPDVELEDYDEGAVDWEEESELALFAVD